MTRAQLQALLDRLPRISIAVVGDFFLDKYLIIDTALTEVSIETGLDAYQVVAKRLSPGAAGTVTCNLHALGVGTIYAVGVVGDDGEGYELQRALHERNVRLDHLIGSADLFTPTYTKPMMRDAGAKETESNRQDIKNRAPIPHGVEQSVIAQLRACAAVADAIIIADQVQERNCGVITDAVREELAALARTHPTKPFLADSRERIGEFRDVTIKPNRLEAARALAPGYEGPVSLSRAEECGVELARRTGRPAFVTVGEQGVLVCHEGRCTHVPGVRVEGETDIVGAGDATTAGIVSSLAAGASLEDAARVGCLVASITVQQIGTTGTASPEQVLQRFSETAERA
jgi:rfaE bifunctional protein kinase chain/domain